MLRRALVLTVVAVALSAAGALAFAPSFAHVSRALSRGGIWFTRGFTPVPAARDSQSTAGDGFLQNGAGVPGTYCPIPPRNAMTSIASPSASNDPQMSSSDSAASSGKIELLAAPPAASCPVPPPATPAPKSILP
jgi:hypothetical protein